MRCTRLHKGKRNLKILRMPSAGPVLRATSAKC
nr:MAG TPA: hypothetical protein [Caudoviricetes sp.]